MPTGLQTRLPQPPPSDAPQSATNDVVITVLGNGATRLNEEPIDLAMLRARLLQIFGTGANSVVFICGEKNLDFAEVAEVIDIVKGAGVDRLGLMTR